MDSVVTDVEEGYKKIKELMDKKKKGGDVDGEKPVDDLKITAVVLLEDQSSVAVGRSDGTVFVVKIGSESYAAFVKKQAIAMSPTGSVSTRTDFVREDDLFGSAAEDGAGTTQPEEVSSYEAQCTNSHRSFLHANPFYLVTSLRHRSSRHRSSRSSLADKI